MAAREKPDVTVVSGKGQVVIPLAIRKKLGLEPRTKLLVYGYRGAVIMKKLEIPDVAGELKKLYRRVDARIAEYGEPTDETINEIIQEYRKRKAETS